MTSSPDRNSVATTNGSVIEAEIEWFTAVLDMRFRIHGGELEEADVLALLPPPTLDGLVAPYAETVRAAGLSPAERLILILAALPHWRPQALDPFLIENTAAGRRFTEFGGAIAGWRNGFMPTRETALFLLAGETMDMRLSHMALLEPDRPLLSLGILEQPPRSTDPGPWLPLVPSQAWLGRLAGIQPLPTSGS